jgi:5-oxoprolinase (ATP-hydrolysing)
MLGRIQPAHFPSVFGERGDQPLDAGIVREQFAALARQIGEAAGGPSPSRGSGSAARASLTPSPQQVAAGFLEIAVANMANAIKKISVQRGYDVTQYVLATFGGAGGQHACAVADALGITRVLIHPLAGVLSAYGMGLADVTAMRETAVEAPLAAPLLPGLDKVAGRLEAEALAELAQQGIEPGRARPTRRAHLRYDGTDTALPVPLGGAAEMVASFEQAYRLMTSATARPPSTCGYRTSRFEIGVFIVVSRPRNFFFRPPSISASEGRFSCGTVASISATSCT